MSRNSQPFTEFVQSVEDKNIRELMTYFRLEDYDVFVRYLNFLGIENRKTKPGS